MWGTLFSCQTYKQAHDLQYGIYHVFRTQKIKLFTEVALEFFYSNLLLAKRNWNGEIIYIIQNVKLMKTVIGWITMKNTFQSPIQTSGFHCHSVKRWNILSKNVPI